MKKNENIIPKPLTDELAKIITDKISSDFDSLEPRVEYSWSIKNLTENDATRYIEVLIYDREFVLSPYFSAYMINLQSELLWPSGIYNLIMRYEPHKVLNIY